MKKSQKQKLTLQKIQISKFQNLHTIKGGGPLDTDTWTLSQKAGDTDTWGPRGKGNDTDTWTKTN